MKTMIIKIFIASLLLVLGSQSGHSQGSFVNLNFENPVLPLTPVGFQVPSASAIPNWRVYLGENEVDQVVYNTVSIGAAAVSLQTATSSFPPIAGSYSVILQPQFNPNNVPGRDSAAIAQTGQVPAGVQSLRFFSGSEHLQVSFAGQPLPVVQLGSTGSYLVLGADIAGLGGQTGELRFTMPSVAFSYNIPYLDNIVFSSQAIPEPSVLAFWGLSFGLFCWRSRQGGCT